MWHELVTKFHTTNLPLCLGDFLTPSLSLRLVFDAANGVDGAGCANDDRSATVSHARRCDNVGVKTIEICGAIDRAWSVGRSRHSDGKPLSRLGLKRMSRTNWDCVLDMRRIVGYAACASNDCSNVDACVGACAIA